MLRVFTTLLILLLAQSTLAKSPPAGTGFTDVKTNVLIMLNASSSMNSAEDSGDSANPYGVAFDSSGNIYVAKYYSNIERYSSTGTFDYAWGEYGTGNGEFHYIYAIAIDSLDNIYVSDAGNGRIQKFDTHGVYQSEFALSTAGARGVAAANTQIYAVNGSGVVEQFNQAGVRVRTWTNTGGYMIAADSAGNLYVTENVAKKVRKYDLNGTLDGTFSLNLAYSPFGITVDAAGNVYVGDYTGNKIYKYSSAGALITSYGTTGTQLGKLKNPAGLAARTVGATTNVWVADYNNNRVQDPNTQTLLFSTSSHQTSWDQAKIVMKDLVTNSNLTDGANFGLITYNSSATLQVPISSSGAATIYSTMDSLTANGQQNVQTPFDLAYSYLHGASSPIAADAWCQNTLIILISNGVWSNTDEAVARATQLYTESPTIKSFLVGANVQETSNQASNYLLIANAGGTYPDSPVFADSWQQVYEAVAGYIQSAINANLTFSAPTIMPSVENGDSIIQSTFKYKTDHQWKGSLNKYPLNDDGSVGSLAWNAGSLLAVKTAASRQIWTVGTNIPTSLNNFTTTNMTELRTPMTENGGSTLSDNQLTDLINYVRGTDSYAEFTGGLDDDGDTIIAGERWKLGDIYHSRAVAVGTPNAYTSDTAATNSEAYYRYNNGYNAFKTSALCGTACTSRTEMIYAGANDGMLHAFNSETGEEEWAFIPPSLLPNLKTVISTSASKSVSIYGVDGSPVVKDIYYGGQWRTILMCGLRQGGKSYFALDVTNPAAPTHLFTISHNTTTNKVSYWNSAGVKTDYTSATVPDAYNFFTLGESWSKPNILLLPVGVAGAMKWTAVFGGGYNSGTNTSYGAQLFILDLENGGQIINNIALADTIAANGIVSAIPPNITVLNGDSTSLFTGTGSLLYVSDLEGKMWKVNLTTSGTLYATTKLFNAESTSTNTRYSFQELATTVSSDNALVHLFGTGNMQSLGEINASIANRAYAIRDSDFPTYSTVASMSTITSLNNMTAAASCPASNLSGWYINLNANEKITGKATIANGEVLFPRYTANTTNICSSGNGSISEHDLACGMSLRTTSLGAGVPTEAVVYKNKIYIGISTDQAEDSLPDGFTKSGNLIVGTPVNTSTPTVTIRSWWEDF
jgi:type IV pilus assembly protein PilY1